MKTSPEIDRLSNSLRQGERLTPEEGLWLAQEAPLSALGMMATLAKEQKSGMKVYYNRNFHLEPTNVCVFNCRFCSYRQPANSPQAWDLSVEELLSQVESHRGEGATEIHITGGVHPRHELPYYLDLIQRVKAALPTATIKAFSAIELRYMIEKAGLTLQQGLLQLQQAGMGAIPGGGAEIFAPRVREQLCPEKGSAQAWLEVHETAHQMGLNTNATILYGHIETWTERIDHLDHLRKLQDKTGGFNALIPLKYRRENNPLGMDREEVGIVEDMRMMALARLYVDNIPHIKAYWPMFGKTTAQLALAFGADDMDGTIDDSTKIYSMAGAEEEAPRMTLADMETIIRGAGYEPVERDTFYNPVKK